MERYRHRVYPQKSNGTSEYAHRTDEHAFTTWSRPPRGIRPPPCSLRRLPCRRSDDLDGRVSLTRDKLLPPIVIELPIADLRQLEGQCDDVACDCNRFGD